MAATLLTRVLSSVARPCYLLRSSATCSVEKLFSKRISTDNRPKHPLNAYIRFCKDQQPIYRKQHPDISLGDLAKKIAHVWRELPASDKQPYVAAARADRQVYEEQMAKYKAEVTPAQEEAWKEERRRKMAKRRAAREKKQLRMLGRPKRSRTAFNIFMAENYQEAKGASIQGKMKNLFDEWQKIDSSQKQRYQQLAEDDKIRYENEMKSWEEHMVEIGRADLIRKKTRRKMSKGNKTAKKTTSKRSSTILQKYVGSKLSPQAIKEKRVKAKQYEE